MMTVAKYLGWDVSELEPVSASWVAIGDGTGLDISGPEPGHSKVQDRVLVGSMLTQTQKTAKKKNTIPQKNSLCDTVIASYAKF